MRDDELISGERATRTISFSREIKQTYLPKCLRYWDDQAKVPWLYNEKTKIMISYEDEESIAAKAKYVTQKQTSQDSCGSCKFGVPRDKTSVICLRYPPTYPTVPSDPQALGRFRREAKAASSLNHPNKFSSLRTG
jgi:Glycosyl hydrolases family 18